MKTTLDYKKICERMSMTAVIESIERDAFRQVTPKNIGNIEDIKIECETLGDEPVIMANSKKDEVTLKKCFYVKLSEHRCNKCNRLLGKFNGQAEIKCPKCGEINRIDVNLLKNNAFYFLETEKRISKERINEYAEFFDGVPVDNETRKELLKSHIRFCDRVLKFLN